ncbi:MAG: acyltransferase [Planctomycetaceae bacterium]|nr:acyltransferase [Planctomycetaceae bacterium]
MRTRGMEAAMILSQTRSRLPGTIARRAPLLSPVPSRLRLDGHIPALDAVRGLAILLVMAYHFNLGPEDPSRLGRAFSKLLHLGGCGVDLFFVLSGFLITGILYDAKGKVHYFRDFYIRRSVRIFPLYYGVLFVSFGLLPLATSRGSLIWREAEPHQAWLWMYASNLFLSWKEAYLLGGFNHFWSLAIEEHFYLFWPAIIYLCDRKRGMMVCVGCMLLSLACRVGLVLDGDHPIAIYVLTPCRMDALAAGAFLALVVRGPIEVGALRARAILSATGCAVVMAIVSWWKCDLSKMDGSVLILRFSMCSWLFATLLLFALTAAPDGPEARFWNGRLLRFFGKYSYGLYVFHYPLIPLFERLFPAGLLAERTGWVWIGKLLFIALAMGTSLGVALLSWNLYEKHFLKLKGWFTGGGRACWGATPAHG